MKKKTIIVLVAVLLALPLAASKSYIIQDSNGNPILIANGTDNNVGIGNTNPDAQLDLAGNLTLNSNSLTGLNALYSDTSGGNFFGSCTGGQVVESIDSDGTVNCIDPAEDIQVEDLSETLTAGNVANQSIQFDSSTGVQIGDSSTSTSYSDAVAIGNGASASGDRSVALGLDSSTSANGASALGWSSSTSGDRATAIGNSADAAGDTAFAGGFDANASGISSIALGDKSEASNRGSITIGERAGFNSIEGKGAIAIGSNIEPNAGATAAGNYAISVGRAASASSEGSVAIGPNTTAPNSYEATFGNLDSEKLDINVTGNATIHGQNLDLQSGDIENFFDTACNSDEMVRRVYPNGSYVCTPVSAASTTEDLQQTLDEGNWTGGIDINMTDSELLDYFSNGVCSSGEVLEGVYPNGTYRCTDPAEDIQTESLNETLLAGDIANQSIRMDGNSILMGSYRLTDGGQGIQIGDSSTSTGDSDALAIGGSASASGTDAVAIGQASGSSDFTSVALGSSSSASNSDAVAIGPDSDASGGNAVALGSSSSASGTDAVAIGRVSDAAFGGAVAIGQRSKASADAVAIGKWSRASTTRAITIGYYAGENSNEGTNAILIGTDPDESSPGGVATGDNSIGLGTNVYATANGAVAIGDNANAPNSYEATFGNLQGQELDVNVTGNLTVHGSQGIELESGLNGGEAPVKGVSVLWLNGNEPDNGDIVDPEDTKITIGNDVSDHNLEVTGNLEVDGHATNPGSDPFHIVDDLRVGDSGTDYNFSVTGNATIHGEDLDLQDGDIENFFDNTCSGANEVVKRVYANGSYVCDTIPEDEGTEGLPETLAANNTANTTIEFDGSTGIMIGNGSTSTSDSTGVAIGRSGGADAARAVAVGHLSQATQNGAVAVGQSADASGSSGAAFGSASTATGDSSTALGGSSSASNEYDTAIGYGADASGGRSIALGYNADTDATGAGIAIGGDSNGDGTGAQTKAIGAVAIGADAVAPPDQYKATFGSFAHQRYDVNVTGNLTVHGDSLDVKSGDVENVDTVNPSGSTVSTGGDIDAGGQVQTETVASSGRMCLGDRC